MSASTTTETRTTQSENRTRRGNRGRGRGNHPNEPNSNKAARRGGHKPRPTTGEPETKLSANATSKSSTANNANAGAAANEDEDATAAVCWICAEPVKYYSLSACNHRTCHVCALRLRALYKKLECTFCKEPQSTVIFTTSPDADFSSYMPDSIPYKDAKLAIFFETEDMMEETLILLRFNCPDVECEYTASGWGDLKLHARAIHGKMLCDLCIRSKKVFAHEHALYPPNVLPLHLPFMLHQPSKQPPKEPIEGGIHPLCEFCRECFFSDDELFVHMRERHEECFLCKRNEVRHQYFQNYASLERHFSQAHFACTDAVCQAQKFVVFNSELDLKAHQVEVHAADMSSKDKKDVRRVQAEFTFDDTGGSNRRGRRDRGDREREQEPPPPIAQALRRRREAFGGYLTTEVTQTTQPAVPSGRASPIREDVDPLVAERHAAFITRLQNVAPNPNNAATAVKAAMRGYRANESSARDLISTVWNVLDHNLDDTASIINGVIDLLEEEEKKRYLLAAWNSFKIEQRQQFPDLVPTAVGSGYAGITSGRVLNAKHATASRSSSQSSRHVWDRVAQAASASSSTSRCVPGASAVPSASSNTVQADRFPRLTGPSTTINVIPGFRQPQRQTPWVSSSSASASGSSTVVAATATVPAPPPTAIPPKKKGKGPAVGQPPTLSVAAFPELPTAHPRAKPPPARGNASLRYIFGDAAPTTSAWNGNGNEHVAGSVVVGAGAEVAGVTQTLVQGGVPAQERSEATGGKGRKGKGKQKQTLFTLGSFQA
ncbi:hypothetical protein J3R82DRAFT_6124 [Butyriboletus roseoflavus]|nr:hypothetical protein J3R82DRAFT_6124 [Butyriboletus roseoflavus]